MDKYYQRYYQGWFNRDTTYEDIYYLAEQIHDSAAAEYENPAILAFLEKLELDVEPIPTELGKADPVRELATEATKYIKDVVQSCLSKKPERTDYLKPFKDACLDADFGTLDLFTLNHDTLLEDYLCKESIDLTDGFEQKGDLARFWNPKILEKPTSRVRLIKLHGSVSWQWYDGQEDEIQGLAIRTVDPEKWLHLNKISHNRAEFLAGTFNKMLTYTVHHVYLELYLYFWQALKQIDCLVVCGYGFGDKAINARIVQWKAETDDRRIIVIDPKSEADIMQIARGMITKNWDRWKNEERLIFINKSVEEVTWNEIKDSLFTD